MVRMSFPSVLPNIERPIGRNSDYKEVPGRVLNESKKKNQFFQHFKRSSSEKELDIVAQTERNRSLSPEK